MRLPLILSFVFLFALSAEAQELAAPAGIEPGERVRVVFRAQTPSGDGQRYRWTGEADAVTPDTLYFSRPETGYVVPLALSTLDRLEIEAGRSRTVWRSAGLGAGVGAAAFGGLVVGVALTSPCNECHLHPAYFILPAAVVGAGVGGLVGLGVGRVPRTQWEPVELPGRVSFGAAGAGAGLVWRLPAARR